jgi:hypothetical protein
MPTVTAANTLGLLTLTTATLETCDWLFVRWTGRAGVKIPVVASIVPAERTVEVAAVGGAALQVTGPGMLVENKMICGGTSGGLNVSLLLAVMVATKPLGGFRAGVEGVDGAEAVEPVAVATGDELPPQPAQRIAGMRPTDRVHSSGSSFKTFLLTKE